MVKRINIRLSLLGKGFSSVKFVLKEFFGFRDEDFRYLRTLFVDIFVKRYLFEDVAGLGELEVNFVFMCVPYVNLKSYWSSLYYMYLRNSRVALFVYDTSLKDLDSVLDNFVAIYLSYVGKGTPLYVVEVNVDGVSVVDKLVEKLKKNEVDRAYILRTDKDRDRLRELPRRLVECFIEQKIREGLINHNDKSR